MQLSWDPPPPFTQVPVLPSALSLLLVGVHGPIRGERACVFRWTLQDTIALPSHPERGQASKREGQFLVATSYPSPSEIIETGFAGLIDDRVPFTSQFTQPYEPRRGACRR